MAIFYPGVDGIAGSKDNGPALARNLKRPAEKKAAAGLLYAEQKSVKHSDKVFTPAGQEIMTVATELPSISYQNIYAEIALLESQKQLKRVLFSEEFPCLSQNRQTESIRDACLLRKKHESAFERRK